MVVEIECATCGMERSYTIHQPGPCIGCAAPHEHHEFALGAVTIRLTATQVADFVAQGDASGFKGNDLIYPIYEALKNI